MTRHCTSPATSVAQRGVALVVVMLILLVVVVLGVGGAQIALLSERTARYDRDYLIASQAAEAALMDAEFDIRGPNTSTNSRTAQFAPGNDGIFASGCSSSSSTRGLCLPYPDTTKPVWARVDFLDTSTSAPTVEFGQFTGRTFDSGSGIRPARRPRYIIELIDDQAQGNNAAGGQVPKMYRVTAMGFGPRVDVQVVLQMVFRKEKG
jgi:type IV pilus assembly protein PilX